MLHATVGSLVEVSAARSGEVCLLDLEAGLEHFCQHKQLHADTLLVVVEPYFKSLESGRRMIGLGRQLEATHLALVANKVSDDEGREAIHTLAGAEDVEVVAEIPHDTRVLEADLAATALLDYDPGAPAIAAIDELAERLLAGARQ
jgi:CO dehydrogenase maturation factor